MHRKRLPRPLVDDVLYSCNYLSRNVEVKKVSPLMRRLALSVSATALLSLLLACAFAPARDAYKGTPLSGEREATDFELTDQFGSRKSLRQDFAGKVVVLTFLYTECPDVCPIVANHLRDVSFLLEDDSPEEVAIVIVSVDPAGDTIDSALAYSERWKMAERWTYLVGEEAALRDVWKAYYIDPYVHGPGRAERAVRDVSSEDPSKAGISALVEQTGRVIHSAPIYIIDGKGVMRSVFTLPAESQDILHDVRLAGR